MVTGLLGKKLGMTRLFLDDGRQIDVTLLEMGPCPVVQRKTEDADGYDAVQLGFGDQKPSRLNKPTLGHFAKSGISPKRLLKEFRVDGSSELKAGDEIKADLFVVGERVDVSGVSKGKGFQGVIKRHGIKGGPGGHGSMFHRAPGSIGQSADPSKVFKNVRLPGHMGSRNVTTQNLEVVRVDAENNLVAVRGSVPGAPGTVVVLSKSVKSLAKGAQ
jgi:large subunit ribosomal protein L3